MKKQQTFTFFILIAFSIFGCSEDSPKKEALKLDPVAKTKVVTLKYHDFDINSAEPSASFLSSDIITFSQDLGICTEFDNPLPGEAKLLEVRYYIGAEEARMHGVVPDSIIEIAAAPSEVMSRQPSVFLKTKTVEMGRSDEVTVFDFREDNILLETDKLFFVVYPNISTFAPLQIGMDSYQGNDFIDKYVFVNTDPLNTFGVNFSLVNNLVNRFIIEVDVEVPADAQLPQ